MTRNEAIEILTRERDEDIFGGYTPHRKKIHEAETMAIEALKDRPKGEWVEVDSFESEKHSVTDMRCNLCGKYAALVLPHGTKFVYPFCPYCGADMRGEVEE